MKRIHAASIRRTIPHGSQYVVVVYRKPKGAASGKSIKSPILRHFPMLRHDGNY
jgi:hypothetical protein